MLPCWHWVLLPRAKIIAVPKIEKRSTMRTLLVIVLVLALSSKFAPAQSNSSQAGEIKVLIVGNDSYPQSGVFSSLGGTPRRDADAVEKAFISIGVAKTNITKKYDLNYRDFFTAIYSFRQTLNSEDSAIFYYSGHGFSIDERAFFVPVDFKPLSTKKEVEGESVSLDQIKRDLSKARMRGLIIDACRTNIPRLKQASSPDVALSLTNLYDTKRAGMGELIVFASQGGKTASADAPAEGLSFFTYYFIDRLNANAPDLGTVALQAQIATYTFSKHSQQPDVKEDLGGYLLLPSYTDPKPSFPSSTPTPVPPTPVNLDDALPLICPKNRELLGIWQIGDEMSVEKYAGLSPIKKPFMLTPAAGGLQTPVSPYLLAKIKPQTIQLNSTMMVQAESLFDDIDEVLGPPLGPPNHELRRSYRYVSRDMATGSVEVGYEIFDGTEPLTDRTSHLAIKDLSRPMQSFISQLEQLGAEKLNQECDSIVRGMPGARR
jgi:Caspase domain